MTHEVMKKKKYEGSHLSLVSDTNRNEGRGCKKFCFGQVVEIDPVAFCGSDLRCLFSR